MSDDKPRGFTRPPHIFKQTTEVLGVQCRRCLAVWSEEVTHYGVFAGYARSYDYCSKCITPEENATTQQDSKE